MTQQTLLVLIGLPGSGKSTLARIFREQGWTVVNQDELGDRKACEAACWRALSAGHSVVIDRCNHTMQQRLHWLEMARRLQGGQQQNGWKGPVQLAAICLELPAALCLQRAEARSGHATLPPEQAAEVIQRFLSEWQAPARKEGFDVVQVARTSQEAEAAAAALLAQAVPAAAGVAGGGIEPAIPLPVQPPGGVLVQGGAFAAQPRLNASAAVFQPGAGTMPVQMPAQQQGWQNPQQGWQHGQQGWHQHTPQQVPWQHQAQQQGWRAQAAPPQQQWQAQPRQAYSSRADTASSWRRGEGSSAPVNLSVPRWGDDGAQHRHLEQHQQRGWASDARSNGAGSGDGFGAGAGGDSNILPFPRRSHSREGGQQPGGAGDAAQERHLPRRHPWQRHRFDQPSGSWLDAHTGDKPILMFDANGTVTSHTSMRRSAGVHRARPGIPHLRRLKEHFHVGMYSSATAKTVDTALQLLEAAAGPGDGPLFDRKLTLNRSHTALAPLTHVEAGGKEWDTVKPLLPYFQRTHRVLLIDDDGYKASLGEEGNMVLMPCWSRDDPSDVMVGHLVDVLIALAERLGPDPDADVRQYTAEASAQLAALAKQEEERRQAQQQEVGALGSPPAAAAEANLEGHAHAGVRAEAAAQLGEVDGQQAEESNEEDEEAEELATAAELEAAGAQGHE